MDETPAAPWNAWGDSTPALSRAARRFLAERLGGLADEAPAAPGSLPPSRLSAAALEELAAVVGTAHVVTDDASRLRCAGGLSYQDLLHKRAGRPAAPDAVVRPADAAAVVALLRTCGRLRVAVVPFGGGTSVVGGVEPAAGDFAAVVSLDLGRLDRLVSVDRTSLLAVFQPGIPTPAAERALAAHGLTLGHLPQSYLRATLGGYAVTRSAGQASTGHGRFEDLVVGLRLATPRGELVLPARPASAAGPDLRRLIAGSEGTLGVVTEVTVRVRPLPAHRSYVGWMLPDWAAGLEALRAVAQAGCPPDVVRLSDEDETAANFRLSGTSGLKRALLTRYLAARRRRDGALAVVGAEGDPDDVRWRLRRAAGLMRGAGAVSLGEPVGAAWEHGRFTGPYLRDTLLDAGLLVETLETATTWTALPRLYAAARSTLTSTLTVDGTPPLVGCHVSHLYATGASLYFTVLARRSADRFGQWPAAKRAVTDAIVAADGTVTHHHAVGTDHRPWLRAEIGDLGVDVLRAVKDAVDPVGVLNPGKLLP